MVDRRRQHGIIERAGDDGALRRSSCAGASGFDLGPVVAGKIQDIRRPQR
jgi:hypothetical protein